MNCGNVIAKIGGEKGEKKIELWQSHCHNSTFKFIFFSHHIFTQEIRIPSTFHFNIFFMYLSSSLCCNCLFVFVFVLFFFFFFFFVLFCFVFFFFYSCFGNCVEIGRMRTKNIRGGGWGS